LFTVSEFVALLAPNPESPAKVALTPLRYVPALIFEGLRRLPLDKVATPLPFVTALPTEPPFSVKVIVFPDTAAPPIVLVRVAVITPVVPP
jgi:hypothetical protein